MKLYESNLIDFIEVDGSIIRDGLTNGTIIFQEKLKEESAKKALTLPLAVH